MTLRERIIFSLLLVASLCCGQHVLAEEPTSKLDSVTLQLKWKHQFQFAGYYAAKEKGFYKDAGLEVNIKEAAPGVDSIQEVAARRAQFGIGTSELILNRFRGDPIIVLGVIFQHSPLILITLSDSGIDNIHKLVGRKVMIEPSSAELFAYLNQEGFTQKAFELQHHSFDINDLLTGRTDAMSVYTTDEPYQLMQQHREYNKFSPRMSGIDFYGDNFFTLESEQEEHPHRVKAFREATLRGWRYAMQNPEEIVQLIYQRYSQRHSIAHLQFEAKAMHDLMQPELIDPGYMNIGRWQHIAQTYHSLGILPEHFDVEKMLYFPNSELDLQKFKTRLYYAAAILCALSIGFLVLFNFYRRARISEARLNTMFNHAPLGIVVLDNKNRIVNWNSEAERTFSWKAKEVTGKNISVIIPRNERNGVEEVLTAVQTEQNIIFHENVNIKKDGQEILCEWINAPFKSKYDKSNFIICMARDITARKILEKKLEHSALHDSLTSLPNRALILEQLKKALALANRHQAKLALLFLDINRFKEINDTLGHEAGDLLLKDVGLRLTQAIREADYVGRLGGDEFLVVLQDIGSLENAERIANKLHESLARPCDLKHRTVNITVSIGISIYPDDATHADALIHHADQAMYQIKKQIKEGS